MVKLSYEDYEKNKSLFKEEYLVWDSSKQDFIKEESEKVIVEIKDIEKLSAKEKYDLKMTLDDWKKELQYIDMKKYIDRSNSLSSSKLYTKIADKIETCLCNFEYSAFFYNKDNNYFCCYIKHNDLYVAIGIFSIEKDERKKRSQLEYSLAYPQSQSVRKERKNGTFGACGHNLRISMINYIFADEKVKSLTSQPLNNLARDALKKLKFN